MQNIIRDEIQDYVEARGWTMERAAREFGLHLNSFRHAVYKSRESNIEKIYNKLKTLPDPSGFPKFSSRAHNKKNPPKEGVLGGPRKEAIMKKP